MLTKEERDISLLENVKPAGVNKKQSAFLKAPDRNISDPMFLTHGLVDPDYQTATVYEKSPETKQAMKLHKSIDAEPNHFFYRKNEEWPEYSYKRAAHGSSKLGSFGPPQD